MTFLCASCGNVFDGEPHGIGPADLKTYQDGEAVSDIRLFACDGCFEIIQLERTTGEKPNGTHAG